MAQTLYCESSDVRIYFGSLNVDRWADLNNSQDPLEIEAAIESAIEYASSFVDSQLRGRPYGVPFLLTDPDTGEDILPLEIRDITRKLAGYRLHYARGMEDADPTIHAAHTDALKQIKQIISGQMIFDLPSSRRAGSFI